MTIIRTLNTTFTGGNSAKLPFYEHGTGVSGASMRWLAKRQAPADGAALTSMSPAVGSVSLVSSGTAPVMVTDEFGNRAVRFDGVDDILQASGVTNVKTLTVVARVRPAVGTEQGILHTGGSYVNRTTSTGARVLIAGSSSKFPAVDTTGPKYHVATVVIDGASGRYALDGVQAEVSPVTLQHTEITIGRASSAIFGAIDVLEVIANPAALTATQTADVYAALKANYGAAIA